MRKLSVKAILAGNIVDLALSFLVAVALATYKVHQKHIPNHTQAPLEGDNISLPAEELLIGLVCSVFAGFVAARIAKHDAVMHGGLSSILCTLLGLALLFAGKNHFSLTSQIMLLFAGPVCGMLGGYLKSLGKSPASL